MKKNNWSYIWLSLFAIAAIVMFIFRKYVIVIWASGCVGVVSIFMFSYTKGRFDFNNNKGVIQRKNIKALAAVRHDSGINDIIYELYVKRAEADFLTKYKDYVSAINFMTETIETIEFDITLVNYPLTIFIRYDEGYLMIATAIDSHKEPVFVKYLSKEEIIAIIDKELIKLTNIG